MRTQITLSDWKKLKVILTVTKLYCSTIIIFWLIGLLGPASFMATVSEVVLMVLVIEWLLAPLSKRIRASYEIVSPESLQYIVNPIRTRPMKEAAQ